DSSQADSTRFGATARKLSSTHSLSISSGTASFFSKRALTHPLLPRPYPVGEANGNVRAYRPETGNFTLRLSTPFSRFMNRNTLPLTLKALWPQGNSSLVSG